MPERFVDVIGERTRFTSSFGRQAYLVFKQAEERTGVGKHWGEESGKRVASTHARQPRSANGLSAADPMRCGAMRAEPTERAHTATRLESQITVSVSQDQGHGCNERRR